MPSRAAAKRDVEKALVDRAKVDVNLRGDRFSTRLKTNTEFGGLAHGRSRFGGCNKGLRRHNVGEHCATANSLTLDQGYLSA